MLISDILEMQCPNVLKETESFFKDNEGLGKEVEDYFFAFRDISDLIPDGLDTFFSGHLFPFYESVFELEASFYSASRGLYRIAFSSLRNVFELSLMYIYYDMEGNASSEVQEWLHSKEDTPAFSRILRKSIFKAKPFDDTQFKYLNDEIKQLFSELCNFTHLKGKKYSNQFLGSRYGSGSQFNNSTLKQYIETYKEVIKLCLSVYALKYPVSMLSVPIHEKFGISRPIGHFLNEFQSQRWKDILGEELSEKITKLADTDDIAQEKLQDILAMPDKTESEIEDQIFDQHTDSILLQGLEHWMKGMGKFILNEDDLDNEETKKRKQNLKERFEGFAEKYGCKASGLDIKEIYKIKQE